MMAVQSLVRRMSRLIEKEFGCTVLFVGQNVFGVATAEQCEHLEIALRNQGAARIYSGADVVFPVKANEIVIGAAVLVGGFNVRSVHVDRLEKILNDAFSSAYTGGTLTNSVQELESYIESLTVPENVIFLADVKQKRRQHLREFGLDHENLVGRPVFVHASKEEELQKIAVDIHRELGSVGFVPWFALDQTSLNSVESLKELGPVTIFVSELEDLDSEQQQLVEKVLADNPHETVPQFIFGSQKTLMELMTSNGVTEGLAKILQQTV
jgi:hypothetical protein